jgi:uncharacterized protein involved in response to NO
VVTGAGSAGRGEWQPFLWAALALALAGGFGLGGALFLAIALRQPLGLWWVAAAQAHGHVQLFGWAGLIVVGVGLHFLPRLRGAATARSPLTTVALVALVAGLGLRLASQPLAAALPGVPGAAARAGLGLAGALELLGVTTALARLARALAAGPPLRTRAAFRQAAPFLFVAFASYWLATALTCAGLIVAAARGDTLLDAPLDRAVVLLGSAGFLWPISVAMSARLFPLHFQTRLPIPGVLRASLGCMLGGIAAQLAGIVAGERIDAAGQFLQAVAIGLAIYGLGVFGRRRPLPRPSATGPSEPRHLCATTAYAWLALSAILLAWEGLAGLGLAESAPSGWLHAFGAGFVTLLILGVGTILLPGFANRPLRDPRLLWPMLILGNFAALARVVPPWLAGFLPDRLASGLGALAGFCGMAALVLFGINLAGGTEKGEGRREKGERGRSLRNTPG